MAAGDKAFWADISYAVAPPLTKLVQAVAQSLANASDVALTFTTEDYDSHNFHDPATNNTRITPSIPGWYDVRGTVVVAGAATLTSLAAVIYQNASQVPPLGRHGPNTTAAARSASTFVALPFNGSTDYVELRGNQISGGAMLTTVAGAFTSVFEVKYLRPL